MNHLKPAEILEVTVNSAVAKSKNPIGRVFILAILAGAFIGLAGAGASMSNYALVSTPLMAGLGKTLGGMLFACGLMMVVLAGGELFTGNNLMLAAVMDKKIKVTDMVKNWVIVYIGNFIGGIAVAYGMYYSGLLNTGNGLLAEVTVNTAVNKVSLGFGQAVVLGIFCNLLVCIAVWMANGADSTVGKIFSMFFPIWLFVTIGFEHSIANMYFIPAGLFIDGGATAALSWGAFVINNLIPVTIGNIIGGSVLVGAAYTLAYKK